MKPFTSPRWFSPQRLSLLAACCSLFIGAPSVTAADEAMKLAWDKNMLTISGPQIPGGYIQIWYIEAFCKKGSTHRDWEQTVIPQKTQISATGPDGHLLTLRTVVQPRVEVYHEILARADEVDFTVTLDNRGTEPVDLEWFQPCVRVDRFTGLDQTNYVNRSFIYTKEGLQMLNRLPQAENAIYKGGQVYVPTGINLEDVNPRPINAYPPANGLIGCFSADGKKLLATAWDQTQELFQGVIVCLHNDPHVGGLKPGEVKKLHGKLYLLDNNTDELLKRYQKDFPAPPVKKEQEKKSKKKKN